MALLVAAAVVAGAALAQSVDEPIGPVEVKRIFPDSEFNEPIYLTHAGDGSGRLFVVEQRGVIASFALDPAATPLTFLDIQDRVNRGGTEEGLLGLAFAPDFAATGHLYVYYSASNPRRSVLSRFSATGALDAADPGSELIILEVPQPFRNHNGGMIDFGPDGYLYVALGDGGSGGDPQGNGQNRATLLGSILRIDVSEATVASPYRIPAGNPFVDDPGARPEIWAYGFRNPWRFSFDRETRDLWVADVGQERYEEAGVVRRGENHGWNLMEGANCFAAQSCDQAGLVLPVTEYEHDRGCAVTGGYVYRGSSAPALAGAYVYADYCSGRIWGVRYDGSAAGPPTLLAEVSFRIPSFGVDEEDELYVLGFDGDVHRIVAPGAPLPATVAPAPSATAKPTFVPPAPPLTPTATSTRSAPTPTPTAAPAGPRDKSSGGAVLGIVVFAAVGSMAAALYYLTHRHGARPGER